MFHRIRGSLANHLQVDWGAKPIWQTPLPARIYDGETLHLFATFAEKPESLPKLTWEIKGSPASAQPEIISQTSDPNLPRLGGANQMRLAAAKEEALALALKYQLVSEQSALFLVHLREEDKAAGLPALQQVPQMYAAGHAGLGRVRTEQKMPATRNSAGDMWFRTRPPAGGTDRRNRLAKRYESINLDGDNFDIPAYLRHSVDDPIRTPREILDYFNQEATASSDFSKILAQVVKFTENSDLNKFLAKTAQEESLPSEQTWAVFLNWLIYRLKDAGAYGPSRQALRLLRAQLSPMAEDDKARLENAFMKQHPTVSLETWNI
jgi:hypothetical protein